MGKSERSSKFANKRNADQRENVKFLQEVIEKEASRSERPSKKAKQVSVEEVAFDPACSEFDTSDPVTWEKARAIIPILLHPRVTRL